MQTTLNYTINKNMFVFCAKRSTSNKKYAMDFKTQVFPNKNNTAKDIGLLHDRLLTFTLAGVPVFKPLQSSVHTFVITAANRQSSITHISRHSPPLREALEHDTNVTHVPYFTPVNLVLSNTVIIGYN